MKKLKLLFAALALLVGSGASAQETPVNDGIYYMYNEASGLFLTRGETWGTQAVAKPIGMPWKVTVADGKYTLRMYDLTVAGSTSGFGANAYTDNGSPIQFTPAGDAATGFTLQNAGNYITCPTTAGAASLSTTSSAWKFLTQSQYDAVLAAKVSAQEAAIATAKGITIPTGQTLNDVVTDVDNWAASATIDDGLPKSSNWTATNHTARQAQYINWGDYGTEMYQVCNGHYTRTITGLKKGIYKVSVRAMKRVGTNANCYTMGQAGYPVSDSYLSANGNIIRIKAWYEDCVNNGNPNSTSEFVNVSNNGGYTTEGFAYVGEDGNLTLDVASEAYWGSCWLLFNGISYTFYTNEVSDDDATTILSQAATLMEKPMQTTVKNALTSAKNTFDGARTIENYNALSTAMTNANTSVTAYANAKTYFDEAATVLANTNVYTATAYATYYTEPKAKYDAGTLTIEEANTLVKSSGGWHSENTIDDILLSSWTSGGTQCKDYNTSLYINTWSTEGNTDGSEFYTPFYEYWTGDGNSLGANTLTSTITGLLPNGTYSFTMRARARNTDNKTIVPEKIMMKVGEGTAVDISAGAHFGSTQFYIGNFSAVGQADAEGKLVTTITVSEGSNVSWLSFYNCKYTEGEDLSAYIADYEFALNTAKANNTNTAYAAITGKEKADLETAISTYGTVDNTDKAALIAAKNALETASNAFVNAAYDYTTLADLNENVATKLGVTWPTVNNTTTAADINAKAIVVAEVTAAKAYATDVTDKLGAWSATPKADQKGESWDGTTTDTYYDSYNGEVTMTQNVTLAEGDYALIFKCRASAAANVNVTDGTNTVRFAHKGNTGYGIATDGTATFDDGATYARSGAGQGWEYRVLTFTSDGTTPTTLTFNWNTKTNLWAGLDDIELRANLVVQDYSALEAAYNAVASNVFGFEKDEYAPYTNLGNMAIVKAAKDMLQNKDAVNQAAINSLKDAIVGLTWTVNAEELNAIYDGTFAAATHDGAPAGWRMSNNTLGDSYHSRAFVGESRLSEFNATNSGLFLRFDGTNSNRGSMYYYGDTENYGMPLKEGKVYRLTVDAANWGNATNKPLRLNVTGPEGFTAVNQQFNTKYDASIADNAPQQFNIVFKATVAGNYVINFQVPGDGNEHNVIISNLVLKTAAPEIVEVTAAGYATYVSDNDLDFTYVSDLTAYRATISGSTITFNKVETVPAGEGVLLKGDAGTYIVPVTAGVAAWADDYNAFIRGTDAAVETGDGPYNYILNMVGGVVGFYKAAGQTVATNRAYIQAPVSAARLSFIFDDEEITGINAINALTSGKAEIYNAKGVKIDRLQKGMNIIKMNGKIQKVMLK